MSLNYFTWDIDPTVISIGWFQLRWYGILFAASFFFGYIILAKMFRRDDIPIKLLDKLVFYMGVGTLAGARLGHCLLYNPKYYLENPIEMLMIWKGGLASHGSAIGILLAILIFCLIEKKSFLMIIDRMVVIAALSAFFIRMGNFTNSEIIGKPGKVPWAFVFPEVDTIPRHPAQLYEAGAYFLIFVFLLWMYYKYNMGAIRGLIFSLFLILIFGFRIFVEFFKERQVDIEQEMFLNLGQIYSIPFVIAGIGLLIKTMVFKKVVF